MGAAITALRGLAERICGSSPPALRLAGGLITLVVVGGSGLVGWGIERLALGLPLLGLPLLLAGLASGLAGRSLEQAVQAVLAALPGGAAQPSAAASSAGGSELEPARQRLAWIVGRDVAELDAGEILRACAETAGENGVDGLFAPLFWMLVGAAVWSWWLGDETGGRLELSSWPPGSWSLRSWPPGPLALVWMFKAASTLDSMLGYRRGKLRWLGSAGARLDDILTWLPCRLVAFSLPLLAGAGLGSWGQFRRALREGAPDPSPNAGVSQAAYGLAAGVRLGGVNRYGGRERAKPLLAVEYRAADRAGVTAMLALSRRLALAWLLGALPLMALLQGLGRWAGAGG
jgi:adenosylcobinamide-phosphate synthase